jgi:hypothetical protein
MARKPPKTAVVAFKVESELADLLNKLPNKSAFIRKAIAAQLGVACPLCKGKGVVPRGIHDHFAPLLAQMNARTCEGCGNELHLPMEPTELSDQERGRLEQFFLGGPLYCDGCYTKTPSCEDCGWHIPAERIDEHHRKVHSD